MSAPASSASPTASLPLDLLTLIIGLLPRPGRLRICSLVCKRWHTAAVRTVSHLEIVYPRNGYRHLTGGYEIYPCVTSIHLNLDDEDFKEGTRFPPGLRALKLSHRQGPYGAYDVHPSAVRPPDTLSSLKLHYSMSMHSFVPWLHQFRTSLTKLAITFPTKDRACAAAEREFLCDAHLCSLTHLSLYVDIDRIRTELLLSFLERHSRQLVSLELNLDGESTTEPPIASFAFPSLRKLFVRTHRCNTIPQLVEACPRLDRLCIFAGEHNQSLEALLCVPRVRETFVWLQTHGNTDTALDLLTSCTRLEMVSANIMSAALGRPDVAAVLLPRLAFLSLGLQSLASLASGPLAPQCRTLLVTLQEPCESPPMRLPRLSTLFVNRISLGLADAVAQVRYIVACAPRLQKLDLGLGFALSALSAHGVEQMARFLRDMAEHGVEVVDLSRGAVTSPRLKAVARSLAWMQVLVGCEPDEEAEAIDGDAWEHAPERQEAATGW